MVFKNSGQFTGGLPMKKILIVENEHIYRPLWEYVLQQVDENIWVDWSAEALEAERKILECSIKSGGYDLVFADIFLSGSKTGLELWRHKGSRLKKIIFTSSMDYSRFLKIFDCARDQPPYLKKPFDVNQCIHMIDDFLN